MEDSARNARVIGRLAANRGSNGATKIADAAVLAARDAKAARGNLTVKAAAGPRTGGLKADSASRSLREKNGRSSSVADLAGSSADRAEDLVDAGTWAEAARHVADDKVAGGLAHRTEAVASGTMAAEWAPTDEAGQNRARVYWKTQSAAA